MIVRVANPGSRKKIARRAKRRVASSHDKETRMARKRKKKSPARRAAKRKTHRRKKAANPVHAKKRRSSRRRRHAVAAPRTHRRRAHKAKRTHRRRRKSNPGIQSMLTLGAKILGGVAIGAAVAGISSVAGPLMFGSGPVGQVVSKGAPIALAALGIMNVKKYPVLGPAVAAGGIAGLAFTPVLQKTQTAVAGALLKTTGGKAGTSGYQAIAGMRGMGAYKTLPGPLGAYRTLPGPLGAVAADLGAVAANLGGYGGIGGMGAVAANLGAYPNLRFPG